LESLGHVDATLRLLDPIRRHRRPSKRISKRIRLFRQGELSRLILSVMPNANSPIKTHAIVAAVIKAGGHGPGVKSAMMPRARGNLNYLHRRPKGRQQRLWKSTR
jgi:hypothetical protein